MKKGWFLLLGLSAGLNAGLLYAVLAARPPLAPPLISGCEEPIPAGRPVCPPWCCDLADTLAHHRVARIGRALELSEPQQAEMTRIREEAVPRILAERNAVREALVALRDAYSDPETAPEQVRALVRRLNAAQGRLDSLASETLLREAALLTSEQRRRYVEIMPWRERRGGAGAPCEPPRHPRDPLRGGP